MSEQSDLDRRLRAVERTLTDGDHDVAALRETAAVTDRLDDLEARITDIEERTAELDAANQAVRGYVGNVRAVNEEVEDRADAALAAVDRIEQRLDDRDGRTDERRTTGGWNERESAATWDGRSDERSNDDAAADRDLGIEMPPPESTTQRAPHDEVDNGSGNDDRSVIERVREAL